jgi:hypothetical protein
MGMLDGKVAVTDVTDDVEPTDADPARTGPVSQLSASSAWRPTPSTSRRR